MRSYLFLLLFAGIVQAITIPANIDKAKMDDGSAVSGPHYPFVPRTHIIPVDSSAGEYSMWTQWQECLAYNPALGYVQFVCRGFAVHGNLDVWQNDSAFGSALTDVDVYTGGLGPARYPTSVASDDGTGNGPHISFPFFVSGPSWGGMGGQYERGGWFGSYWDPEVDLGPGDVNTHKNIGKQLANTNILFIGVTDVDEILYRVWDYQLSTQIASGTICSGYYYWGYDYNGGTAYVFYYDTLLNVYYKTTTDGVNWSAQQTWTVNWPNPYTNNIIGWTQAVVTDAGNPILIFDNWNGDDYNGGIYPFRSKVYVSTASGANCIEVGNTTTDSKNFYPTIASEGNYVVALFGQPRSGTDSLTFWDVYYNYSTDNGATWHTPINLTSGIIDHNNCLWQIAKRLNPNGNGTFYFAFGSSIFKPMYDLYYDISYVYGVLVSRWYVGRNPIVGIAENKTETPKKFTLNITPNPARNQTNISYALPKSGNVSLNLYSADGRLIKKIEQGYKEDGIYTVSSDTHNLANGIYIIVLRVDNRILSGKLVVAH